VGKGGAGGRFAFRTAFRASPSGRSQKIRIKCYKKPKNELLRKQNSKAEVQQERKLSKERTDFQGPWDPKRLQRQTKSLTGPAPTNDKGQFTKS